MRRRKVKDVKPTVWIRSISDALVVEVPAEGFMRHVLSMEALVVVFHYPADIEILPGELGCICAPGYFGAEDVYPVCRVVVIKEDTNDGPG